MRPATAWREARRPPELSSEAWHVWRVDLRASGERLARLSRELTPDERARAERYLPERATREFTVTRATLRRLLAAYLNQAPERVELVEDAQGKPHLRSPVLSFNVSHSHGVALLAFASTGAVGVDIEKVRPEVSCERLAERYFSDAERAALRSLPPEERAAAFFRCWTRKEAWLKAKGTGLRLPLAGFDVTLAPGEARLLATRFDPGEAERWWLADIASGLPGFEAALAGDGAPPRVETLAACEA